MAINALVELIRNTADEFTKIQATSILGEIDKDNPVAINALVELIRNTADESIKSLAAESLWEIDKDNPVAINALVELIRNTADESTKYWTTSILGEIDKDNPVAINALVELICNTADESIKRLAANSLGKIGKDNPVAINALVELIRNTADESIKRLATNSLGEIDKDNSVVITALVELIRTAQDRSIQWGATSSLIEILTEPQQMLGVVSALKDCLSDEVYQNDFDRFNECYEVIWNCAKKLPYPEFYQAWHHSFTTSHPKVMEQTPVGQNSIIDHLETQQIDICQQLQNLPIICLKATILNEETDPSEIAQTLCQLIWEETFPNEDYPKEVTTASKLREHLKKLKLRQNLTKLAILITDCHPNDQLITLCHKITNIITIAFLTDQPLEATLKGFPPNQPNLLSAIQNWLEEI